jgi:hypothetical protein
MSRTEKLMKDTTFAVIVKVRDDVVPDLPVVPEYE